MNLKMYKIFRLILVFSAFIGWISVFIIMALYTYGLLTFNISTIWAFVSGLCLLPVGAALFQYMFSNFVVGRFQKNIEDFRNSQKFCYACGKEIISHKPLMNCPECKADLRIVELLLKI